AGWASAESVAGPWHSRPGDSSGTEQVGPRDWRTVTSGCLAVAAIVCLFLGNLALWMRQDVYSASHIEQEAQHILRSSDVPTAVADLLTTRVVEPALGQAGLGPFAGVVKAPATSVVRRLVNQAMSAQPTQHVAARLVEQVAPELNRGAGPVSLSPEQLTWIV